VTAGIVATALFLSINCLYFRWTKAVYPDKLKEISGLSFAVQTYTPTLARLKTGLLLREILTIYDNKTRGTLTPNRRFWMYSAHDTTVANMLNTLNVFKALGYHNPPFASAVLFELRELDGKYRVQVFYKNSTAEPMLLNLPVCGASCELSEMFRVYREVLPVDWEAECTLSLLQMPLDANIDESLSLETVIGFIAVMLCVGTFVLLIAQSFNKRKDYLSESQW
jgi:lysosomal acid phosphatase